MEGSRAGVNVGSFLSHGSSLLDEPDCQRAICVLYIWSHSMVTFNFASLRASINTIPDLLQVDIDRDLLAIFNRHIRNSTSNHTFQIHSFTSSLHQLISKPFQVVAYHGICATTYLMRRQQDSRGTTDDMNNADGLLSYNVYVRRMSR